MKKRKGFTAAIVSAALLCPALISTSFLSYSHFGVINPFSTASGLAKVMFTDTQYVEIQQSPRVIIAKPDASLDEFMQAQGYSKDEEKQMGALCTFTDGSEEELISYSCNKHFSKWCWQ